MNNYLLAIKRHAVWRFRTSQSALSLESDSGERPALWVFDTRSAPDGYSMHGLMTQLAQREGLRLFSFGPTADFSFTAIVQSIVNFWGPSIQDSVRRRIKDAALECGAELYVVGSINGTFAKTLPKASSIWEVQHGLLDSSYFPIRAARFFTRSSTSYDLLASSVPLDKLTMLNEDLSPPQTVDGHIHEAKEIICYSKNPGGGCTTEALANFEQSAMLLAKRLNLPFRLQIHPRDNWLKLVIRHRRLSILKYVYTKMQMRCGSRLVVSSFSTALASETITGDLLLNVRLSAADPITEAEYGWLPAVSICALKNIEELSVVKRL